MKNFLVSAIKLSNIILIPVILVIFYLRGELVAFFALSTLSAVLTLHIIRAEVSSIRETNQKHRARELAVQILLELADIEKKKKE